MPDTESSDGTTPLVHPLSAVGEGLSRRARLALLLLAAATVLGVSVVWLLPDASLLHFWLVAQALPLLYCVLTYWGCDAD